MPTYDWKCTCCERVQTVMLPIGEYCRNPPEFVCCGEPMTRYFSYEPDLAVHNALAGDRHYDGLRATDGTDVSTRSKHRQYMKERGLTTMDDYTGEWARAAQARADVTHGIDPARRGDIERAIEQIKAR